MTWPASDVPTNNLDNDGDNPALARADLKDMADKVNQIRNHVTAFGQSLVDDADASAARTTLGASATGGALFTAATASDARTTLGLGTAATKSFGTSDGNLVEVQTGGKLPALDGSLLINLPSSSAVEPQIFDVSTSVAFNALTVSLAACTINFRNATLTNGTPTSVTMGAAASITVPSGAALATQNGVDCDLVVLALYTDPDVELAIVPKHCGLILDELGVISTSAISGAPDNAVVTGTIATTTGVFTVTAVTSGVVAVGQYIAGNSISPEKQITSLGTGTGGTGTYNTNHTTGAPSGSIYLSAPHNVVYSTTARSNVPYRVIKILRSNQTTAGLWASAPTVVGGSAAGAVSAMSGIGEGFTWKIKTRSANVVYGPFPKPKLVSAYGIYTGSAWNMTCTIWNGGATTSGLVHALNFGYAASGAGMGALFYIPAGHCYRLMPATMTNLTVYEGGYE